MEQTTTIGWQRLAYYFGLAVVEATPPALLITLAGGNAWAALVVAVGAGALADWIMLRRLPPARQGPALVVAGLLVAWWVVRWLVAGEAGIFGGWGAAIDALFSLSGGQSSRAYLGLLTALYCFWRGTRLTLHDTISLHRLFRGSTVVIMLILGFGFLGSGPGAEITSAAITQMLIFFAVGLITIAIASASEERETELRRMGWRGLLTLLGAVGLVLVLGLLIGAVFFEPIAAAGQLVVQGLVLIATLVVAPIVVLIAVVLTWLFDRLNIGGALSQWLPSNLTGGLDALRQQQEALDGFPRWLSVAIQLFCGLVPILLIVTLLLLSRRRAQRRRGADEERESLWSWGGLASDLLGLLKRNTPPPVEGLREALARLRGGDPASRIRRSYIRLLLLGESRGTPRAAPQTPREYAANAANSIAGAAQPIATLTEAYERARYNPSATTAADAAAAEQSWETIDQAGRRAS
jgi:hypothetical protein